MELQPNIDEVLSGFDPTRPVGQGGMASIYMYENRLTGEQVAVKTLHSHVVTDSSTVDRFFHEVQASIRLDHKNIVNILGYGQWNDRPSMVMEYIDGGDLKALIEKYECLPAEVAAHVAYQLFKGLDYSHRLGIIHRDIKPSNILISRDGYLKITDFGISQVSDLTRLTMSGDVLGTPAYMSPEQASGKKLDERSDVFSAGVLLYEMLSNTNPFLAENPSVTLLNIIRCNVSPVFEFNPTVPYKLEVALDRLLARDPMDRVQSAAEAAELMEDVIRDIRPDGFTVNDFSSFLRDPNEYINVVNAADSLRHLEKGKTLLTEEQDRPERAAVEFYRSLFLDPGNVEARQYLTSLTEKFSEDGVLKPSEKLLELETAARNDPNNIAILLQLVKRARSEGDFIKAVGYSKRLARLRPKDVYILGQIETLLPNDHATAVSTSRRQTQTQLSTKGAMASEVTHDSTINVPQDLQSAHRDPAQRPRRPVPRPSQVRRTGRKDNTVVFVLIALAVVILGAVFSAKWFNRASEQVQKEMPAALDNFLSEMNSEGKQYTEPRGDGLKPEERMLLQKAQNAHREGNRPDAIRFYQEFIGKFKTHPESDGVRIQLSRLLVASGDVPSAIRTLDDQLSFGKRPSMVAYARLEKIRIYQSIGNTEESRWECIYLEPNFRNLGSPDLQIEYLSIFANISRENGRYSDALRLYETIINNYSNRQKILEARMMKAEVLIEQGDNLGAQKELWKVRDQSRPDTLLHKNAVEKLATLGLGDSASASEYR